MPEVNENYLIMKLLENPRLIDAFIAPEILSKYDLDIKKTLESLKRIGLNEAIVNKAIERRLEGNRLKPKIKK